VCTPVRVPENGKVKVSAQNGTGLSCRNGRVVIELRPPLGRRKRADGDRLTERVWVWGGSVASGRVGGKMRNGWKAGLVVRAERQRQALEEGGEEENDGHIYIRVR
jgi:hypothetical protein